MKTLDEHNNQRIAQCEWGINTPKKNGIACNNCGNELIDSSPNEILTCLPPKTRVRCDNCGFVGYRCL